MNISQHATEDARANAQDAAEVPAGEVKIDVVDVKLLFPQLIGRSVCISASFLHGLVKVLLTSPAIAANPRHAWPMAESGKGALELVQAVEKKNSRETGGTLQV